ncbi:PaaI family thioesterase [Marinicrinis sediminis]|uniref:Medium/long-chain acyl-CoA thioesterase YigI n=1 Tax=Marinicrinis sediminis TaxID=1652465 RepID=A0ABW5RDL1_9BACL
MDHKKQLEEAAKDTFWGYLGCSLLELSEQQVSVSLQVKPHHHNLMGIVHGGVLSGLMDNTMGVYALQAREGKKVVTSHLNLHFLEQAVTEELICITKLLHETRKGLTIEAKVWTAEGKLCAFSTGTFRVLSEAGPGGK